MKMMLSAQQFVHFHKTGHVRLEEFPVSFEELRILGKPGKRDLWRDEPRLKKLIMRSLAPIGLEITKKMVLRLGCDQWIDRPLEDVPLETLFCFQRIACIFVISENEDKVPCLDIFDPTSSAAELPEEGYLVLLTQENGSLIENVKDPFCIETRNLGYVYGDPLKNEFHPRISLK